MFRPALAKPLVVALVVASCTDIPSAPHEAEPEVVLATPAQSTTGLGYTAIDLGSLGGRLAVATDINDHGHVVGYSSPAPDDFITQRAFLWKDGVMIDLGTLGGDITRATAINDAGQVIGWGSNATGTNQAFLWEAGVVTPIARSPDEHTDVWGMNEAGQVVGSILTSDGLLPFIWHHGSFTYLPTLGGSHGVALSINDAGQVAGLATGQESGFGRAVVWEPDGSIVDLGFPATSHSAAWDINEAGDVTGIAGNEAFVRRQGAIQMLGFLGFGSISAGLIINRFGQVAGTSYKCGFGCFGVFVESGGTMTEVAPSDPAYDLVQLGRTLPTSNRGRYPRAFNDLGQVVGMYRNAEGLDRGYVWQAGQFTELETLGGEARSYATAVNTSGLVVGTSRTVDESLRATLWRVLTPVEGIERIDDAVVNLGEDGVLGSGEIRSLSAKLMTATALLNDDMATAAANVLAAFVNRVEALLAAGSLSPDQAQELIDAAESVLTSIGAA